MNHRTPQPTSTVHRRAHLHCTQSKNHHRRRRVSSHSLSLSLSLSLHFSFGFSLVVWPQIWLFLVFFFLCVFLFGLLPIFPVLAVFNIKMEHLIYFSWKKDSQVLMFCNICSHSLEVFVCVAFFLFLRIFSVKIDTQFKPFKL